ncbi:hypothetical protein F5X97DRAFT_163054 [Nemania serpens]|nr:hypothetical protein F5X97DRAFT_163054 [Nemania serpens]
MPLNLNLGVSSFLVLLGENEELAFRRANKRLSDVLSLAPVSGLQAYLRSYTDLIDVQDRDYISPYGRKKAPLRNIRLAQMITRRGVLDDGYITICKIDNTAQSGAQSRNSSVMCRFIARTSWIFVTALVYVVFRIDSSTWVGKSNLIALSIWSIFLRTLDAISLTPTKAMPSFPDKPDAAIFLGRRNSAFVLEGSRRDILQWTGLGLRRRPAPVLRKLHIIARVGTFLLLAFMFSTIPNGSTEDQAIFISYNLLGQLNTWLGLHMHTRRTLLDLGHVSKTPVATRTHVYATLLRLYREENWAEDVDMLPRTPVWNAWQRRVVEEPNTDAKVLWEECATSISKQPTSSP